MVWLRHVAFGLVVVLLSLMIGQVSTFLPNVEAAQIDVGGTLQERVTESGEIVFNSSGDGTFSFKILDDGSVHGSGEIQRTWTISGPCNIGNSDRGTVDISGSADLTSKKLSLKFSSYEPEPSMYNCGDLKVGVYSPTYRFSNLRVDMALETGAVFEQKLTDAQGYVRITIGQISGVNLESFDFSISARNISLRVAPGDSVQTQVSIHLEKGTAKPVTLKLGSNDRTILNLVTGRLTKVTDNPPFLSDLTLIASPDTPKGTYNIAIIAEGGGVSRYTILKLVVEEKVSGETSGEYISPPMSGPFDFDITIQQDHVSVSAGEKAVFNLVVRLLKGTPQPVQLFIGGQDDVALFGRADWDFDGHRNKEDTPSPVFISTLSIETAPNTRPGIYHLEVEGVSKTVTHSAKLTLEVKEKKVEEKTQERAKEEKIPPSIPAPKLKESFRFEVGVNPHHISVVQGEEALIDVIVKLIKGDPQGVELGSTQFPLANIFPTFVDVVVIPTDTTILDILTTCDTPTGTYPFTIHGNSEGTVFSSSDIVNLEVKPNPLCNTTPPIDQSIQTQQQVGNVQHGQSGDDKIAQTGDDGLVDFKPRCIQTQGKPGGVQFCVKARIGPDSKVRFPPFVKWGDPIIVVDKGKVHMQTGYFTAVSPGESLGQTEVPPSEIKCTECVPIGGIGLNYGGISVNLMGTEILVDVNENGTKTLTVLKGKVAVGKKEDPNKTVLVNSGQQLVTQPNSPLSKPVIVESKIISTLPPLSASLSKLDLKGTWWEQPPKLAEAQLGQTPTSEKKGGGCLIATAAFGSELAPQVQQLRETRDSVLSHTQSGTAFMTAFNEFYYSFSPTVADWERENPIFKEAVKITITPLITTLSILNYVDIDSEAKMLGYGIGMILLNIGMYFVAPTLVMLKLKKQFQGTN